MKISEKQRQFRRVQAFRSGVRRVLAIAFVLFCVGLSLNDAFHWVPGWTWHDVFVRCGIHETPSSDWPCTVRAMNVGAGDCFLIQCEGQFVVIDTGTEPSAERVAADLIRLGAQEPNYLFLSHYHDDHTGGISALCKHLRPKTIVAGVRTAEQQSEEYRRVHAVAQAAQIPIQYASAGDSYAAGPLQIEVLADGSLLDSENDRSLVLRVTYQHISMLFTGDMETLAEQALLQSGVDVSADWLKIAHHGSKTSTSEEFLSAVSPRFAAISCGRSNPPDEAVLRRLHTYPVPYVRTDLHGETLFATDGTNCATFTENS